MEIKHYHLHETENGYTITVYLDEGQEEFSKELGQLASEKVQDINEKVRLFVKQNFKNLKVVTAKVVVGSLVLTTIPIGQQASAHSTSFNMSYLFAGSSSTFLKQVEQANGHLSTAAPSYFEINPDGSLKVTYQFNRSFITEMHNKGIKVVPFISNHWDRTLARTALENRENLTTEIAKFIEDNDIDGINVDLENLSDVDRDAHTDFIKLLREKIPAHKEVSVAVAANPGGWTKGWHGSYDYHNMAKYADYLMIMAYDESYPGGPEGPIASLDWVEKGIQYALNEGVPSSKIVLGLPFFGRYWIEGKSYGGYGISMNAAESMIEKYNGQVIFDEKTKSPMAVVTIGENDPTFKMGSRTLGPGTYHISYENEESIKHKVDLVHKYDLKGTGSWALGQETAEIWNEFGIWLAGHQDEVQIKAASTTVSSFKDTVNHWAKDDIAKVKERGWMIGINDKLFAPGAELTRAQAATLFVRALNLAPLNEAPHTFDDVPDTYWAKNAITIIKQHGIMEGKSESKFGAEETITREQMAMILSRVIQTQSLQLQPNVTFDDVQSNRWSYGAIADMTSLGIFNGYSDKEFGPKDPLTRAQMAALLNRVANDISPYLTIGSTDPLVASLQNDLVTLGYLQQAPANGVYDAATEKAIKNFQNENGIIATGIASKKTLDKVAEKISELGQSTQQ